MATLQALIEDFNKSVEVIKRERKLQAQILREITDRFCEHKIGQKATIKRNGRIVTIVCKRIETDIWNGKALFTYCFKQLKKDGTLSQNDVSVGTEEITWLNEYIEPYATTESLSCGTR
jgi:hypothetical protein